ncbi:MAG TPA: alpha/beta fold hydrolase [Herpetosiphonaceae bacterium]
MLNAPKTPWLIRPRPNPQARLRLFCFPYAGGGASMYRTWATAVPADIDLCSVQLPGRENRIAHTPISRWHPLVETLAAELGPFLDRPFAFFGYSMGALISFELARALAQANAPAPAHMHVAAYRAPQLPSATPAIHHLADAQFIAELRQLKGSPEDVLNNAELMELILPVLRADFAVCETHSCAPGPLLSCPLTVLGGLDDPLAPRASLEAWATHTSGAFQVRMYPGGHFFWHRAGDLLFNEVLQDLRRIL